MYSTTRLAVAATNTGLLTPERIARIRLSEAPETLLGCRLRRFEEAALTMGPVEGRDG
ncbi:MAG: hypothetical protein ABSF54_10210 [Bryobacteraceae bacterium]